MSKEDKILFNIKLLNKAVLDLNLRVASLEKDLKNINTQTGLSCSFSGSNSIYLKK